MTPTLSPNNFQYLSSLHIVFACKCRRIFLSSVKALSDLQNDRRSQFYHSVSFPAGHSFSFYSVLGILFGRTWIDVGWIHARSYITGVIQLLSFWNRAIGEFISHSVRRLPTFSGSRYADHSVALATNRRSPKPAIIRPANFYFLPKANFYRNTTASFIALAGTIQLVGQGWSYREFTTAMKALARRLRKSIRNATTCKRAIDAAFMCAAKLFLANGTVKFVHSRVWNSAAW